MRRMKSRFLLIAVLTLFTVSCKDDEAPVTDTPEEKSDEGLLRSVLKSEAYDPETFMMAVMPKEQFTEILDGVPNLHPFVEAAMRVKAFPNLLLLDDLFRKETGSNDRLSRQWQMESYVFTYLSTAIDGSEVLLSGRVTFPNRLDSGREQGKNTAQGAVHEVQTLSLSTHPAVFTPAWQPFESLSLFTLRGFLNSAVIEPDLQGLGINRGQQYFPIFGTAALARQLADCVSAALEVMEQRGVRLAADGYTTNWGGSLMASTTLRFHQYYETEAPPAFREAVRLRSTFIASNIRDEVDAVLADLQAGVNILGNFRNIFIALCALSPQQLRGYQVSDFLSERAMTEPIAMDGKQVTLYESLTLKDAVIVAKDFVSKMEEEWSVDQIVAPDMLTPEGKLDPTSPKMVAIREILNEMNETSAYSPTLPLYLCQNKKDELFKESDFQRFCDELSQGGTNPNVHKGDIPIPEFADYLMELASFQVYHFVTYFLALMEMATAETPEEVFYFLNPTAE